MLKQIVAERWFDPKAIIGFWPANAVGDDIRLYTGESRSETLATLHTLRQQLSQARGTPNLALADFIAPEGSGKADYIGGFVVTAGRARRKARRAFCQGQRRLSLDPGQSVRRPHRRGFGRAHARARAARILGLCAGRDAVERRSDHKKYRGIRPAPGYPAQPDHTEKANAVRTSLAERRIGVKLTESFAMWPGSSVSGLYFAHPEAHYFGVGKIERDQVEDYAKRKGMSVDEAERWLAPVLNYDRGGTPVAAE